MPSIPRKTHWPLIGALVAIATTASAATTLPATNASGTTDRLPHLQVDVTHHRVRVECEAVKADYPLEFFCVVTGGNEYEAVVRSPVRPSHLHLALLMLGLKPGSPARYVETEQRWLPPAGPSLRVSVEFTDKDGKTVTVPASRLMRNLRTKEPAPDHPWIFSGSLVLEDGKYMADTTGTIISVVNVDAAVIDIPNVASKAMESRECEPNPDVLPATGTKMWMIIEPAGDVPSVPTTNPTGK